MTTRAFILIAALGLVVACSSDSDEGTDAGGDTSTDGGTDASGDSSADGGTDAGGDSSADVGPPSWSSCALNSDCMLADNSCCGVCSQPELGDVDAINRNESGDHYAAVCDELDPLCPGCPSLPNPWLGATCDVDVCTAFDLRESDLVTCTADADCRLRATSCCECGGDTGRDALIALAGDEFPSYLALVCDPETDCLACEPTYPDTVEAFCNDEGRCDLRDATE
jgi:hypothetical protein